VTDPDRIASVTAIDAYIADLEERRAERAQLAELARNANSRRPAVDRPRSSETEHVVVERLDPEAERNRFRLDEDTVELGRRRLAELRQQIDAMSERARTTPGGTA
jgi:hypothetical protein